LIFVRRLSAASAQKGRSDAGEKAAGVIDKVRGGAYLNRDLSGAEKDAIAVVFRAFVVVIA
jgi:hypothetical protein